MLRSPAYEPMLEAKEHVALMQASVELDALGAAAAGAVPKLVELDRTSARSGVAKAAIEALGKIHNYRGHARGHAPGDPRRLHGVLRSEGARDCDPGLREVRRAGHHDRRSRAEARGAGPDEREV